MAPVGFCSRLVGRLLVDYTYRSYCGTRGSSGYTPPQKEGDKHSSAEKAGATLRTGYAGSYAPEGSKALQEFYTRLTEILRTYLDKRFGINAMEMTSSQIMQHVERHDLTRPSSALMKQILEMADFVKFAKVRPLPDDNVKSFNMATRFVEDTKPAPEPAETYEPTGDTSSSDQAVNNKSTK